MAVITGSEISDFLLGTDEDDVIRGLGGNDGILFFINGTPAIFGGLWGAAGNDSISGGTGNDFLRGDEGNDRLNGGSGIDQLEGGIGNDNLSGISGNDILLGQDGNDELTGGAGNDNLTGGSGLDRFIYGTGISYTTASLGQDTIVDFKSSEADKIVLSKATFTTLTSNIGNGFSDTSDFAIVNSSAGAGTNSARIVYNTASGRLIYNQNGDLSGLGTGGTFAILTGQPTLTTSDFVVQA